MTVFAEAATVHVHNLPALIAAVVISVVLGLILRRYVR